ncbi:MAG: hypothetical protein WAU07_03480 [Microgenomates group bacterium]
MDTSFFGDYAAYPDIFIDFVTKCRDHNITLVTIVPVVAEFTRGSETPDIYKKKTLLIKEIVGEHILSIHPNVFGKEVIKLVEEYGQTGKAVSITDYCLAAMTKIYKVDLCLLTKNPKDFPTSIFAVECYFLLQLNRALQVYGIYTFIDDSFASPEPEPPF